MQELELYIRKYFIYNGIELKSKFKGNSTIKLACYGYRQAGWNPSTANNWIKKNFPFKPKGIKLKTYILNLCNVQVCNKCKQILYKDKFYEDNSSKYLKASKCINCQKLHDSNRPKSVTRREVVKRRTPVWADKEAIKVFYDYCPKDCHVDHIIPLQGKNITGLHIETNLQWLSIEDNLKKGNKY